MIIDEIKTVESPKVDERILNFLDYTVLMLSQVNTVEEIDMIMDDFLSKDIISIMEENKELFSSLSVIWLDTFERVCLKEEQNNFSLKILNLPIMFKNLEWKIEDQDKLHHIHEQAIAQTKNKDSLCPHLSLLFIEGLIFSSNIALNNFEIRAKEIASSQEEIEGIDSIISDILSLGWTQQS